MLVNEIKDVIEKLGGVFDGNTAIISINDINVYINLIGYSNIIHLYAGIGILDNTNRLQILKWISSINLLGKSTEGGFVGVEEKSSVITFSQKFYISSLNPEDIKELLEEFVNTHIMLIANYRESIVSVSNQNHLMEDVIENNSNLFFDFV